MPSLIVSSRFSTDSQRLRRAAQELGWETVRLDGCKIRDWFDPPDDQIAIFCTFPSAFDIAAQIERTLLGTNPDWTVVLPNEFLLRELRQTSLADALLLQGRAFVKHSVAKAFEAGIYDAATLAEVAVDLHPQSLVHLGEPVRWLVEYRCFVMGREVTAVSPYKRHGRVIEDHANRLGAPESEMVDAREYALTVLRSPVIDCPPAFVLDVGVLESRGWAVVEANECWASGIYACDPVGVLKTLLRACVSTATLTDDDRKWDFQRHYAAACP